MISPCKVSTLRSWGTTKTTFIGGNLKWIKVNFLKVTSIGPFWICSCMPANFVTYISKVKYSNTFLNEMVVAMLKRLNIVGHFLKSGIDFINILKISLQNSYQRYSPKSEKNYSPILSNSLKSASAIFLSLNWREISLFNFELGFLVRNFSLIEESFLFIKSYFFGESFSPRLERKTHQKHLIKSIPVFCHIF